jgi:glutamate racemase
MSYPSFATMPNILVFDSGIGGLSVHAEIAKLLPEAHYIYVADDAAFSYGDHTPEILIKRVNQVVGECIARFNPDLIVIACNTASTVCMSPLREAFALPFVGTVPAVKPAAAASKSKMISILGTPGTVKRDYTHDLIIQHAADCRISLVGAPRLSRLAEDHFNGIPISDADVLAEILPCFKEKEGSRTDTIALACTHYPLLQEVYDRVAPWPVTWVDPAPAIAARVVSLLRDQKHGSAPQRDNPPSAAFFTSGKMAVGSLAMALKSRGLQPETGLSLPFQKQNS